MLLPLQQARQTLSRRQTSDTSQGSGNGNNGPTGVMIAAIVVIILLALAVIVYAVFRNKNKTKANQNHLPGDTVLQKFRKWRHPSRGEYSAQLQPNPSAPSLIGRDGRRSRDASREPSMDRRPSGDPERGLTETTETHNDATAGVGVDRNTSVRSVMTLPSYSASARPTEQIIAREGERGGIDTVVEYPEGDDEEEARREEEMESLYQIRRQRREEQAEREERRRLRREARERGDFDTLRRLQQESRQRAESNAASTSAALIAEHQAAMAGRDRRVSSVQYAQLGVAKHDGSRIRGNSMDSDNHPLLSSAASMDGVSLHRPSTHTRGRSGSSIMSVDTGNGSDDANGTPQFDSDGFEVVSLEHTTTNHSRARSTHTTHTSHGRLLGEEADIADLGLQIPTEQPPDYDDPPDYTSPIQARNSVRTALSGPPRLPSLRSIPSIEVTGAVSPLTPTPTGEHTRHGIPAAQSSEPRRS